jgi:hypothetical protein
MARASGSPKSSEPAEKKRRRKADERLRVSTCFLYQTNLIKQILVKNIFSSYPRSTAATDRRVHRLRIYRKVLAQRKISGSSITPRRARWNPADHK